MHISENVNGWNKSKDELSFSASGGDRRPMSNQCAFEDIVFVVKTGYRWKSLPKERFGGARDYLLEKGANYL